MPALVDLMGDPLPSVRAAAVDSLVLFAGRATPLLLGEVVRLTAAEPAGLRLESLLAALGASAMSGRSRRCRQRSANGGRRPRRARGPGDLGLKRGITPLRAVLSDPVRVREAAARANLCDHRRTRARGVIEDYIARETDPRLRERAARPPARADVTRALG